jgi:hypothetical protein
MMPPRIPQLEQVGSQRADDHRAEEHRHVGADNDADGADRADDGTALAVHQPAAGVADQQRQQVGDHRGDEGAQGRVRYPARRDEQRCDQTPRDERADVGKHHRGKVAAEPLDAGPDRRPPGLICRFGRSRHRLLQCDAAHS